MISVVIPAFNEEKYIRECLESIKDQDFDGSYEIIVVDNGSQDNTAGIAGEIGARVVYCPLKGVALARQAGAEAALGDIVVQADADTTYPRWWLTRIRKQFESHPSAVAVAGTFVYRKAPWWASFEYFSRVFWNILTVIILGRPYIISGANFAFYKEALLQIGGYISGSYSADQFDISSRLSKMGRIFFDRKLWCITSERTVTKSTLVIFYEFLRNLIRFAFQLVLVAGASIKRFFQKGKPRRKKTIIKISLPILLIIILCYGYYVPASPVFGKVYYKSFTPEKVIALTFDDGPNDPYTSRILDILDEYNVKATFFLVGSNVKRYPETSRRIYADGHDIGNHTYSHNANHALSLFAYKDIQLAQQAIYNIVGVETRLFRPPHGKKSPWLLETIKREGFILVLWNITTNELSGKSANILAEQIIKKAKPGGVILLHDGYGTLHDTEQANKQVTVEMLPLIIRGLQAKGYTFVTISELLDTPAYNKVVK